MMRLAAFVVLFMFSQTICEAQQVYCRDVGRRCDKDVTCIALLSEYITACAPAFSPGETCSQFCKDSYLNLLSNSVGRLWQECDCGTGALGDICRTFANSVLTKCFGDVKPTPPSFALTQTRQPACNVVMISCSRSITCNPRYFAYMEDCTSAFVGVDCSHQCNESYYNLLRHPVGSKFSNCSCGNDLMCQLTASSKLLPICYAGSPPVPPPTESVLTEYPAGSCENFYDHCYIKNFASCGRYAILALSQCSSFKCSASCTSKLKTVTSSIPYASDLLTCRCLNSDSSVCTGIAAIRNMTSSCGITANAATATVTTMMRNAVITSTLAAIEYVLML